MGIFGYGLAVTMPFKNYTNRIKKNLWNIIVNLCVTNLFSRVDHSQLQKTY